MDTKINIGVRDVRKADFVITNIHSGNDVRIRAGLTSFLNSGQFSEEFMDDVNMMISKVYRSWSLYEDEEEFGCFCWTKIVSLLDIYDSKWGSLSNFIYSIISNEATRIFSKHKKMSTDDITDKLRQGVVESVWSCSYAEDQDFLHRDRICSFAQRAFAMGIYVDQQELYKNYLLGNLTPTVKAFMWSSILNKEGAQNAGA